MPRWLPYAAVAALVTWWLTRSRSAAGMSVRYVNGGVSNAQAASNPPASPLSTGSGALAGLKSQDDTAAVQGAAKGRGSPVPPPAPASTSGFASIGQEVEDSLAQFQASLVLDPFGTMATPGGVEITQPPPASVLPAYTAQQTAVTTGYFDSFGANDTYVDPYMLAGSNS